MAAIDDLLQTILNQVEELIVNGTIEEETAVNLAELIQEVKNDPTKGNIEVLAQALEFVAKIKTRENQLVAASGSL